jgi:putative ABC transport system substrate-binding protein
MRRREFIASLGSAVAWPRGVNAQQGERVRKIGALLAFAENDPLQQFWITVLQDGLRTLGWQIGRNLRIEYRWTAGDVDRMRVGATELVSLSPDLILAGNVPTAAALQRETHSIPIVFVLVADPVSIGFVASLAHPAGNMTGFMTHDAPMAGKRLELLKNIFPTVHQVSLLFNPTTAGSYIDADLRVVEIAAAMLGVEITAARVHNATEIENAIAALGAQPSAGLLVAPDITTGVNRELIVTLAAVHRVPALYPYRFFTTVGGVASYGPDIAEHYRLAAGYVDRILKGDRPDDLPVQSPTKLEFVINLKTAKALGLTIPETLLATADEVIQ